MPKLRRLVDNTDTSSYASQARLKRFKLFSDLQKRVPRPYRILDVGGTQRFWEVAGFADEPGVEIYIFNLKPPKVDRPGFRGVFGDATQMTDFSNDEFDIVFSNSVIEHVGAFEQQQQMASEVRRVGQRYFVQTPNYYFPIEPHFLFPGFQWLPLEVRVQMVHRFNMGWWKRIDDIDRARQEVGIIRLLRKRELLSLFPDAELYCEKVLGLTKSFVVYAGW